MNSGQRIAILVGAVVVLAVGFVLARGSDDEGGREAERSAAETTAREEAANTETAEGTGGAEAPTATTPTQEEAPPPPRVDSVRIRDNQLASGEPKTLKYENGDTVRIRFTSESGASEIHIHGYDKYVNVPDGGSERTRFRADAEGIFEIEDHATGALLAKLEVRP